MITKYRSDFFYAEIENKLTSKSFLSLSLVSVLMNLFFIQAMRAYIPGVYVALSHVVFGENIIQNLLILLTLAFFFLPGLTIVICKRIKKQSLMIASIYFIAILRLFLAFNLPSLWNAIFSGLIITFYGFYISTFLTLWIKEDNGIQTSHKLIIFFVSFSCAFLIDYFIRTIGFSEDISLLVSGLVIDWQISQYFWLIFQIPLSFLCIYITYQHFPRFSEIKDDLKVEKGAVMKSYYSLIFIGIGMFLFLQFSLFLYPNVIAQYTSTNYFFNNIMNIIALMVVICVIIYVKVELISNIIIISILNGILILSMILFLFLGKLLTVIASIFISIALIVMYLDIYLLIILMTKINFKWVRVKSISNIITISFLFYVIFVIFHIFTTDWSFTVEAFHNQGPLILFLAGILFSCSSLTSIIITNKKEAKER
ncbi:MAG: hypothetical protein ACFFBP_13320 [Promethearchaeota archaeon]